MKKRLVTFKNKLPDAQKNINPTFIKTNKKTTKLQIRQK